MKTSKFNLKRASQMRGSSTEAGKSPHNGGADKADGGKFLAAVAVLAVATMTLASCGSTPDISFTTKAESGVLIMLAGNGNATIDWGDGSTAQTVPLTAVEEGYTTIAHPYAAAGEKNATITGDVIKFRGSELRMTSLDVSQKAELTELDCSWNELTSLDVSNNTLLTVLECGGNNELTSFDVSKNTALTRLICDYNEMTSLDVSKNIALTYLDCNHNELTSLDVSNNTLLTELRCGSNPIASLDVSKNTELTNLHCDYNELTALDVSKNTVLDLLWCNNNELTSLDVSENTKLTTLQCFGNPGNEVRDFIVTLWPDGYVGIGGGQNFTRNPWDERERGTITPRYRAR